MRPVRAWFLPEEQDVLGILRRQAESVDAAVRAVQEWTVGLLAVGAAVERVRQLRDAEDEQRRELHRVVRSSFSTPLEPEDVFELAERLVEVLEEAYALVREAQLVAVAPDDALREMGVALAHASTLVLEAVRLLPSSQAADVADDAVRVLQGVEHGYRGGMAALVADRDLLRMELSRRAEHLGGALRRVARRVWYAVAKLE
jgi:uncharacterized protein Yka (UPF0111/DUF47 family)